MTAQFAVSDHGDPSLDAKERGGGAARLVIVKGDLNYRRLVGDLQWPPTTSFADATAHFPAPPSWHYES